MPIECVNVHGQPVSIEAAKAQAKMQPARPRKEDPQEYHRGFLVEGLPPGQLQQAREHAEKLCADWAALSDEERASRLRSKEREPKPWDELAWRTKTKPKRIAKHYQVPEAAEVCRALAVKAGWLEVRVTELKKSKNG